MKRTFTLIILLSVATFIANAQESFRKFRLGIGVEGNLPGSGLKDAYSFGTGLTLRAQYNVTKEIGITLTSGAIAFIPKDIRGSSAKAALDIPVKVGGKYMITDNFYAIGEIGFSSLRVFYKDADDKIQRSPASSSFTYAPGVGIQLGFLDIGIRYEAFENANFIGARVGINF
ncbi:outer membrane beta-barrel protein [Pedobacter heparinus]|uniref:outer membrane beta-barrel protein n=1 Tax=Pedobacter heparinus TaxID=984 RepID=UPI00292D06E1|nr:outer membrane beta-barrel protein [Pedobacter heparinus]